MNRRKPSLWQLQSPQKRHTPTRQERRELVWFIALCPVLFVTIALLVAAVRGGF